jgi:putative ABC transport system permease protein
MFKNFIKITFRNLIRFRLYSIINLSGLSIGLLCCLLIFLYVQYELSFDTYHNNYKKIYRILTIDINDNEIDADSPWRLAPELKDKYPGIIEYVRISDFSDPVINYNTKSYVESRVFFTDPSLFKIFNWELIKGNPDEVLRSPNSIVISQSMSEKYFGKEDPMGKIMTVNIKDNFIVTGIFKDIPSNSHFKSDIFLPLDYAIKGFGSWIYDWSCVEFASYLLLDNDSRSKELENRIPQFIQNYVKRELWNYKLQPLKDIHLYSKKVKWNFEPQGNINSVYIFSLIGILILIVASINYINLSTARMSVRLKEIGIRKVIGGRYIQIFYQMIGESIVFSLIALCIAYILASLLLPVFNQKMHQTLTIQYGNFNLHISLVSITLIVGLISGIGPSVFYSRINIINALKRVFTYNSTDLGFRKFTVIFQFTISIILFIAAITINKQLHYIQTKNLGFKKDELVAIDLSNINSKTKSLIYEVFKQKIIAYPEVIDITASSSVPPHQYLYTSVYPENITGEARWNWKMKSFFVDYNFIDMMGIELIDGRNFSEEFVTDRQEAIIINKAAQKALRWKNAIGKKLINNLDNTSACVIGIVKDFHFKSVHEIIEPAFIKIFNFKLHVSKILLRIQNNDIKGTLNYLEDQWNNINPAWPFNYQFVDQTFWKLYQKEQKLFQLISVFGLLAILISCMGILALSMFIIERRTKEIGVRKISGATTKNILILIIKDFFIWVVLSNIIAWPLGWWVMNSWLQNFAYKTEIAWWIFLSAGIIALVIALITVSLQSIKAAITNPVESLRYE